MAVIYLLEVSGINPHDEKLTAHMPLYRVQKAKRLRAMDAKRLSVGAGLLFCYARRCRAAGSAAPPDVAALSNPADYVIRLSPGGKPLTDGMNFSLSHSGKYAACAVSDQIVGVDIERIRPEQDLNAAKKFLSSEEAQGLDVRRFFEYWTMKESYVKAMDFISAPSPFDYSVKNGVFSSESLPSACFHLLDFEEYKISLCTPKQETVEIKNVSLQKVLCELEN